VQIYPFIPYTPEMIVCGLMVRAVRGDANWFHGDYRCIHDHSGILDNEAAKRRVAKNMIEHFKKLVDFSDFRFCLGLLNGSLPSGIGWISQVSWC